MAQVCAESVKTFMPDSGPFFFTLPDFNIEGTHVLIDS